MATSGTHNFNLSLDTVIQEAYERLGDASKGGYDLVCLLYTSPSPRDATLSRMPSSA